jgi:bifunctional non-homologous end joining protein LigD
LTFAGRVGTGFTDAMLADLHRQLAAIASTESPYAVALPRAESKDARWVRPEIVGEVAYSELTPDGRLRHPVWRGLRPDKDPADVVWEG